MTLTQTVQMQQPEGVRLTMLRCVVAAETYRLTGSLPPWVRDATEQCPKRT